MNAKYLKTYYFLLLTLVVSNISAEDSADNLSFSTSLTFLSTLHDRDDYRYAANSLFSISGAYSLNEKHSLSLGFQGLKKLSGDFTANSEMISLSHSHKLGQFKGVVFSTAQSVATPINKKMRRDDGLRANVAASVAGSKSFDWFLPTSVSVRLLGKKNFNEFETNADAVFLTSYLFSLSPSFSFSLTEKLGLNLGASLVEAFDYAGARSESYSFDNSLGYSFNSNFNASLGISIGGATYIARGNDSNIKLFDSDTSEIYLSTSYSF